MGQSRLKIGVLDSGLGGLSVLPGLSSAFSSELFYYGDLANSPFGPKPTEVVLALTDTICKFLIEKQGVESILIACNTATSASVEFLREKYHIPIFGMEPAIKPAVRDNPKKKVALLATSLTLREAKFDRLKKNIGAEEWIHPVSCDGLSSLIDNGETKKIQDFLKPILETLKTDGIKPVVLGCTHYTLVKEIIQNLYSDIELYDGAEGTIRHIKNRLCPDCEEVKEEGEKPIQIYLNGGTEKDYQMAYYYLEQLKKEKKHVK